MVVLLIFSFLIYELCMIEYHNFIKFFHNVFRVGFYCFSFCISNLFHIFVQVYRPLPPGGNPTAVHEYNSIISYLAYLPLALTVFRVPTWNMRDFPCFTSVHPSKMFRRQMCNCGKICL